MTEFHCSLCSQEFQAAGRSAKCPRCGAYTAAHRATETRSVLTRGVLTRNVPPPSHDRRTKTPKAGGLSQMLTALGRLFRGT